MKPSTPTFVDEAIADPLKPAFKEADLNALFCAHRLRHLALLQRTIAIRTDTGVKVYEKEDDGPIQLKAVESIMCYLGHPLNHRYTHSGDPENPLVQKVIIIDLSEPKNAQKPKNKRRRNKVQT
jgi:hypothetical protein